MEARSYKDIMGILKKGKKVKLEDEWQLVKTSPSQIGILQTMELLPKPVVTPRKRGRPRKKSSL